ncbi:MAG: glycosyltransferase family 2 protein, partial [Anaerolineae bacterium]
MVVVDDGSTDRTAEVARAAGAHVIRQANAGYIAAIKRGFREASGDIIITMDADGEHRPEDIPRLVKPILDDEADLVLGARPRIHRLSGCFLNWLTNLRVRVSDSGTGFHALRRGLALKLELKGHCICGISVLEPAVLGARITEVPIELTQVTKPRSIAWYHVGQFFCLLPWLVKR